MMKISEMLAAVNTASKSVSSSKIIEIFAALCFREDSVTGYNDVTGVRVFKDFGIRGGLEPGPLKTFLNGRPSDKEAKVTQQGNRVTVSCGRSRINLDAYDPDQFIDDFPLAGQAEDDTIAVVENVDVLVRGLKRVQPAIGDNPVFRQDMGVTVDLREKDDSALYATNRNTVAAYYARLLGEGEAYFFLPDEFVSLFLHMAERYGANDCILEVYPGYVIADFGGRAHLFSKTLSDDYELRDFESTILNLEKVEKGDALLNDSFKQAILQAVSLGAEQATLSFSKNEGVLKADFGKGNTHLSFRGEFTAIKDSELTIKPDLIAPCLEYSQIISFTPSTVQLSDKNKQTLYFCANLAGNDE